MANPIENPAAATADYFLPIVTEPATLVVRDLMSSKDIADYAADGFDILKRENPLVVRFAGRVLSSNEFMTEDDRASSMFSMVTTHELLLAQARLDQEGQGRPVAEAEYALPVVTPAAVDKLYDGTPDNIVNFMQANHKNPLIPHTLNRFRFARVGGGPYAPRENQASEFAFVAVHGILNAQAFLDARGPATSAPL